MELLGSTVMCFDGKIFSNALYLGCRWSVQGVARIVWGIAVRTVGVRRCTLMIWVQY